MKHCQAVSKLEFLSGPLWLATNLSELAGHKAGQQQGRDQQLDDLKAPLASGNADHSMRARIIGPGDSSELRRLLLQGAM